MFYLKRRVNGIPTYIYTVGLGDKDIAGFGAPPTFGYNHNLLYHQKGTKEVNKKRVELHSILPPAPQQQRQAKGDDRAPTIDPEGQLPTTNPLADPTVCVTRGDV